jgi:hypothetical protein
MYQLVDANSQLNWSFDWSKWLAEGDEITSDSRSITPSGPEFSGEGTDTVTVLGPLVGGHVYRLTCTVTTAAGLQDERSIVLRADQT